MTAEGSEDEQTGCCCGIRQAIERWLANYREENARRAQRRRDLDRPLTLEELEKLSQPVRDYKRRKWLGADVAGFHLSSPQTDRESLPRQFSRPQQLSKRGSYLLHIICYKTQWEKSVCLENEESIKSYFDQKGYILKRGNQLTAGQILDFIKDIKTDGPIVFLWLSCHGAKDEQRQGILCGQGSFLASEELINSVIEATNLAGKIKIIFFDSCRNGGTRPNLASMDLSETCVLFSAEDGTSTYITNKGSLFPTILISALNYLDEGYLQLMADVQLKYRKALTSIALELGCHPVIVSTPEFFTQMEDDFFL